MVTSTVGALPGKQRREPQAHQTFPELDSDAVERGEAHHDQMEHAHLDRCAVQRADILAPDSSGGMSLVAADCSLQDCSPCGEGVLRVVDSCSSKFPSSDERSH